MRPQRLDGRGDESLDVRYDADPEFAAYVDAYEEGVEEHPPHASGLGAYDAVLPSGQTVRLSVDPEDAHTAHCDSLLWGRGGPDADERPETIMFGGVPMIVEPKEHHTFAAPEMVGSLQRYRAECSCGFVETGTHSTRTDAEIAAETHINELRELGRRQAMTYDEIIAREA